MDIELSLYLIPQFFRHAVLGGKQGFRKTNHTCLEVKSDVGKLNNSALVNEGGASEEGNTCKDDFTPH